MKTILLLLTTFGAGSLLASVSSEVLAQNNTLEETKNLGEKEILPEKRTFDTFLSAPLPACHVDSDDKNNLIDLCVKNDNKLWLKAI